MGLLSTLKRIFESAPGSATGPRELEAGGLFETEIVGESHYRHHFESICGPRKHDGEDLTTDALVIPEPENPKDPKAIRIEIDRKTVGYLSREDAAAYHDQILSKLGPTRIVKTKARIRGGWSRPGGDMGDYGVTLDL